MKTIKTICICGAGTMGSGITQVVAQAGFDVIQYDVEEIMLQKSKANINKGLEVLKNKGKLTEEQKKVCLQNIVFTTVIDDCKADVIIEAIIEDKQAKINLFHNLMNINREETIYATNTSSISVSSIAAATKYPMQVAGFHFFNPAPVMKLVEIIHASQTKQEVVEQLFELAKQLGKTPVICKDSPGFIVNRIARPYYLEAMKLVENGFATIETTDELMEATGFKMGPFKLMDLIGIDINFSVSNIVWEALGKPERLKPSLLQKQKIEAGLLGKKTGAGFYNYS
ncbi:MAG: 3-hydroxyacyl-CoA dehydrogenase family protein [Ilyomonas sp.]